MSTSGEAGGADGADEFTSSVMWRATRISQWVTDSLTGKARSILGTSGIILTVMTVGLVGLAELTGLKPAGLAALDRALYGHLTTLLYAAAAGISSIILSMLFSVLALRPFDVENIVGYAYFTKNEDEGEDVDDDLLGGYAAMCKESRRDLYRSYLCGLRDMKRNNRRMARYVRLGHALLASGLAVISAVSVLVMAGMARALS